MSKKLNEVNINNKLENSNKNKNDNSINNSKMDNLIKNSFTSQLIFFKEDILQEVKELRTQMNNMSNKYKLDQSKNNTKIIEMKEAIETIIQNLELIASKKTKENPLADRYDKLDKLVSKLEYAINANELKLKNTAEKLNEDIYELDNKITKNFFYPLVIGPNGKYKTFHEFIDSIILNVNNLLLFKEKISSAHKDLKNKTETNMNNYRVKLDYFSKNYTSFISSSFKEIEQKLKKTLNETLNIELEKINKNFENYKDSLENKISNINEKLQKIESLEQNLEKTKSELNQKIEINKREIKKYQLEKYKKNYLGQKNIINIIKQYIEGNSKNNKLLLYKKRKSFENNSLILKDISYNISKFNQKRKNINSEPNKEKLYNDRFSLFEDLEIENDFELQKNKIKDKINNILLNNIKTYKALKNLKEGKEGKDKYISSFLRILYTKSFSQEKNFDRFKKNKNNINNKIKIIQRNDNFSINGDLIITNSKEFHIKKHSMNSNDSKWDNSLELLKSYSQPSIYNSNIKKNKESSSKIKILNRNQKKKNKINENKASASLTFRSNLNDKIYLKNNNKNINQNQKNKSNFYKKQNRNDKMNKSQYNKITMSFLDFDQDNKENDEIKMKKIFHDLKDVIQEDENFLIKNKFANYGYNKDIIFAVDKRHVINRNEENKNHNYTINNSDIKVRPYSKSFKRH